MCSVLESYVNLDTKMATHHLLYEVHIRASQGFAQCSKIAEIGTEALRKMEGRRALIRASRVAPDPRLQRLITSGRMGAS